METMGEQPTNSANITFIKSNKGQPMVVLDYYIFKFNRKGKNKKYWICINSGCNVGLHTDLNDTYICGGTDDHKHEPNPEMVMARQIRQNIKERAVNETVPVALIYEQEISKSSVPLTTVAIMPICQEIGPSVAEARRKVVPLLPQTCFFDIPDGYTVTGSGNRFLLLDEFIARRERILMFSSDSQLSLLFNSPVIYMDGTFSKSPPQFKQIYIIHAIYFDICLPCVFCLLANKKPMTYRHIFSELKQKASERGVTFSPPIIITDFESGVLPVIKSEFPTSKRYGCFFHYCQSIYRQIQTLGMQTDYANDNALRTLCRKIMALALIPHNEVVDGFNNIRAAAQRLSTSPIQNLLTYFENNWLDKIDLWNVSKYDIRTNNVCEGYYNRLKNRIHRNHPNIWNFIKFMQGEEKRVQCIATQWAAGASREKNIRTTHIQLRINTLHERFSKKLITASQLLTELSYVVAKKAK